MQFYVEEGGEDPRFKVRLVVPNGCCGGIIGKGGSIIKYGILLISLLLLFSVFEAFSLGSFSWSHLLRALLCQKLCNVSEKLVIDLYLDLKNDRDVPDGASAPCHIIQ
mgnify:CR=1 FL=1